MRTTLTIAVALLIAAPLLAIAEEPPAPRRVELTLSEDTKLIATLYEPAGGGETKPAVIALHGQGGERGVWSSLGKFLAGHGVSVLALDLRGHGESVAAGGAGVAERIAAGDPALFAAMKEDVRTAVVYVRETLLADGRRLAVVGGGVGGSLGLEAAKKDRGLKAVLCLDPDPAACGLKVIAGLNKWDGRPVGLLAAGAKPPAGLRQLGRALAKQPRTETLLVPGKGAAAELLTDGTDVLLETAQWLIGWLLRPELDGRPMGMNVKESSGPGHIVMDQSSNGLGMGGAGGLSLHGYRAPAKIEGVMLMAHPDAESTSLDKRSRRLTFTRAKGKELAVNVKVETWSGKSWKKHSTATLRDCGGFTDVANVNCYEVWLSPRLLGARPFSSVAVTSCFTSKGKPTWKDAKPFKGQDLGTFGGPKIERKLFKISNPSTWTEYTLR